MRFDIITIFPEFFTALDVSLVGKARQNGLIALDVHDLRAWANDVHRTVDDTPFGGGAGMVMKPEIWAQAIDAQLVSHPQRTVLAIPTPAGKPLKQADLGKLASYEQIILACGRYEGIDARIATYYQEAGLEVLEFSLGDYVLNGGEVAALALIEGVARLIPGMMGNPESLAEESHGESGLLEYPVFTRPAQFRGIGVPEVLTSGNHQAIASWRRAQSLTRTVTRRPDLMVRVQTAGLAENDLAVLAKHDWFSGQQAGQIGKVTFRLTLLEEIEDQREAEIGIATTQADTNFLYQAILENGNVIAQACLTAQILLVNADALPLKAGELLWVIKEFEIVKSWYSRALFQSFYVKLVQFLNHADLMGGEVTTDCSTQLEETAEVGRVLSALYETKPIAGVVLTLPKIERTQIKDLQKLGFRKIARELIVEVNGYAVGEESNSYLTMFLPLNMAE